MDVRIMKIRPIVFLGKNLLVLNVLRLTGCTFRITLNDYSYVYFKYFIFCLKLVCVSNVDVWIYTPYVQLSILAGLIKSVCWYWQFFLFQFYTLIIKPNKINCAYKWCIDPYRWHGQFNVRVYVWHILSDNNVIST